MAVVGFLRSLGFTPRESPGEVGDGRSRGCTVMSAAGTLIGQRGKVGFSSRASSTALSAQRGARFVNFPITNCATL
jgi:hypothetical protein